MKRSLTYLAALALAFPATAETLRLGTAGDYRPYAFHNTSGQLQGFDIALGDALCGRMNATCVWIEDQFARLLPDLAEGRFDAVIAAVAITRDRQALVDFTNSYEDTSPEGVFVGIDTAFADVETMSIGVAAGTIHEQHLKNGNLTPQGYPTTAAAYEALLSGEVDLVFGSPGELEPRVFRTSRTASILSREDISAGSTAIAVAKGNDTLRQSLNDALAELRADGTLSRLRKTWLASSQDL